MKKLNSHLSNKNHPTATTMTESLFPVYRYVRFGKKEDMSVKFPEAYDFFCYFINNVVQMIENQEFYSITGSTGKVLLFGIPIDGYKFIESRMLNWIADNGFGLNASTCMVISNQTISPELKLIKCLFHDSNIIRKCDWESIQSSEALPTPNVSKPTWDVISANMWTEIPAWLSIKFIPNGEKITFRINGCLYKEYKNKALQTIKKIQCKPYVLVYLGNNQSVFVYSEKDVYYKQAADTSTDFCFRNCDSANDHSFHVSNALVIYSETECTLEYDSTKVKGEKCIRKNLHGLYEYKILNQGKHQTEFKVIKDRNYGDADDFIVVYSV